MPVTVAGTAEVVATVVVIPCDVVGVGRVVERPVVGVRRVVGIWRAKVKDLQPLRPQIGVRRPGRLPIVVAHVPPRPVIRDALTAADDARLCVVDQGAVRPVPRHGHVPTSPVLRRWAFLVRLLADRVGDSIRVVAQPHVAAAVDAGAVEVVHGHRGPPVAVVQMQGLVRKVVEVNLGDYLPQSIAQ